MAAFTGARNQIKLFSPTSLTWAAKFLVPASAVKSIVRGCPTETVDATGSTTGGVRIGTTQKPTSASNYHFAGLAKSDSTETASVAGYVWNWMPLANLVYSGKSLVTASTNTAAKLLAMMYQRVYFDLTTMVWTIDTAATDAAANGLTIVGGDYNTSTVYVVVTPGATIFSNTA
jgi:hypothetical protein